MNLKHANRPRSPLFVAAIALLVAPFSGCASADPDAGSPEPTRPPAPRWQLQDSGSDASLRGVSAVSDRVVWASGANGTVLRTTDGGATWERRPAPADGAELDYRDVHAVDEDRAWLLTAGTPARVYHTTDGGQTWSVQHEDPRAAAFFDGFAFWSPQRAVLFGDPVDGVFTVLATNDGGDDWRPAHPDALPAPATGEAGFAASGTCIAVAGNQHAWIGTGGAEQPRILRSTDGGRSWSAADAPLRGGASSTGVFSIAFADQHHGVAVGGNYLGPDETEGNAAVTGDSGASWHPIAGTPPRGYRSCVAWVPGAQPFFVTVGTSGSEYSLDGGHGWMPIDGPGFHALAVAPDGKALWATGAEGKIARLIW